MQTVEDQINALMKEQPMKLRLDVVSEQTVTVFYLNAVKAPFHLVGLETLQGEESLTFECHNQKSIIEHILNKKPLIWDVREVKPTRFASEHVSFRREATKADIKAWIKQATKREQVS